MPKRDKELEELERLAHLALFWADAVKREEAVLAHLKERAAEADLTWRRAADKRYNAMFHKTGIHLRG